MTNISFAIFLGYLLLSAHGMRSLLTRLGERSKGQIALVPQLLGGCGNYFLVTGLQVTGFSDWFSDWHNVEF